MVETYELPTTTTRFPPDTIRNFIEAAFHAAGFTRNHASLVATVLVSADLWGIRSHGVARLSFFMDLIDNGALNTKPNMTFRAGSDTTGVLDADNGSGIVAANLAMEEAITRATAHGTSFIAVCNSTHFGFPGYWARKAMDCGLIGICMSNGGRITTPTFGMEGILGSNPLSVAIPGGPGGHFFYLDMATAVVARGKIETSLREKRPIPKGWVPEAYGELCLNDHGTLDFGVPLLPLGGEGTVTGGHKGYALSLLVELLSSILGGKTKQSSGHFLEGTGHFMGAINIKGYREPAHIFSQMAELFETVRNVKKIPGHDRIYIPGELERIAEEENIRLGIPVTLPVLEQIRRLNDKLSLGFDI